MVGGCEGGDVLCLFLLHTSCGSAALVTVLCSMIHNVSPFLVLIAFAAWCMSEVTICDACIHVDSCKGFFFPLWLSVTNSNWCSVVVCCVAVSRHQHPSCFLWNQSNVLNVTEREIIAYKGWIIVGLDIILVYNDNFLLLQRSNSTDPLTKTMWW